MTNFKFFNAREILKEIKKSGGRTLEKAEVNKITKSKAERWLKENSHIKNRERREGYNEGYLVVAISYEE